MGKLDNKVAIVTGGGVGIGREAAIFFGKEGAKVVVADCVSETGESTVKEIRDAGNDAVFVKADMSKATDVEGMVTTCVDTYGKLDILLNNAGVLGKWGPVAELDEEDYDRIIDIDLKGVWLGMRYAIPVMVKMGGGSIVNVASHVAYQPQIGSGIYCAAKAAVIQLSRVAALEYIKRNIRINWVEPGYVLTPMANAHFTAEPGGMDKVRAQTPLGRFGKLEDLIISITKKLQCDKIVITHGNYDTLAYTSEEGFYKIPIFSNNVVDTTGAGDAFFSITSLCVAAGCPIDMIGFIGNAIGALEVQVVCNRSSVEPISVLRFIEALLK